MNMVTAIHQPCVIMPLETSDNDCNVGKFDLVMWTNVYFALVTLRIQFHM